MSGMVGLGAKAPDQKPTWGAGTEVYALESRPRRAGAGLTAQDVALADSDAARAYRAAYPQPRRPRRACGRRSATPSRSTPTGTAA